MEKRVTIPQRSGNGCRSITCKSASLALFVLLLLVPEPASAKTDTTTEWRQLCHKAYFLQRDRRYREATETYNQALSTFGNADNFVTRELRLNIATFVGLSGRKAEGVAALKALEPVFAKDTTSLQAVRYWRRLRDAYTDTNDFGRAIEVQRKVLEIGKKNFDVESVTYLDELRKLMALFGFSHQISEGARIAQHLMKVVPNLAPAQRERFAYDFEILANVGLDESRASQRRKDFRKALNFLHLVKSFTEPKLYMERLCELAQKEMPFEPKLRYEIVSELADASAKFLPDKTAVEINQGAKDYLEQNKGASNK